MKVLVIGDNHFKVNNVLETEEMTKRLIELARKEQPNFIVLLGDILHRHETIHVVPLMGCERMILGLSAISPTYICVGNHDRPNNSNFLTDEHPFNAMKHWKNVYIADKVLDLNLNGYNFLFVPYVPPGRFLEALNTVKDLDLSKVTAIFAHQEFYGAKMGAIVSEVGDLWSPDNPLVISGHIHDYDQLQSNIIYVGTPIQDGFADSRIDKTVSLFTFNNLSQNDKPMNINYEHKRIDLGLPKRIIDNITINEIHSYTPQENRIIKLVIRGTDAEIKACMKLDKIKDLKKKGISIAFKTINEIQTKENNKITEKTTYKDRLISELKGDQLKWFNRIFN